jgi:hypothetical protein
MTAIRVEDSGALAAPGLSLMPSGVAALRTRTDSVFGTILATYVLDTVSGCVHDAEGHPAHGAGCLMARLWEAALHAVQVGRVLPAVWVRSVLRAVALRASLRPAMARYGAPGTVRRFVTQVGRGAIAPVRGSPGYGLHMCPAIPGTPEP